MPLARNHHGMKRLGYLLCRVEADELAAHLEPLLAERSPYTVPLAPWAEMLEAPRDARWHIAINTEVNPDL